MVKGFFLISSSFYLIEIKFSQRYIADIHSVVCIAITAGNGVQRVTDYLVQQYHKLSESV
jgi:hypothetical protein